MHLAFSIIQISREKYIQNNMIKSKLFLKFIELYGVHFDDYKNCYEEIKSEINKNLNENKNEIENNKEKENKKEESNNMKRYSVDKVQKNFNNKVLYVPTKMRSSNATISLKKYEKYISSNEEKEKNKEPKNKNKKTKWERNNHYSIDCSTSEFKSNDTLPLIFINSNHDKRGLNPINIKPNQFKILTENENHNKDKFKSNDKISQINISNIRLSKNKLLTSTKLPKIKLEEIIINNNNNKLEPKDELTINVKNDRKRYKLKTNKNL